MIGIIESKKTQASSGSQFPTDGLIALYNLEETSGAVVDSYGSYDGQNGTVPMTRGVQGKQGSGFESDADSEHATLMDTSVVTPAADSQFSFAAWLYPTSVSTSTLQGRAITLRGLSGASNLIVGVDAYDSGTGEGVLYLYNGSARVATSGKVKLNEWFHVTLTRNATDTKIYLNGTLVLTNTHTLLYDSDDFVYIGIPSPTNFRGRFDILPFYNKALAQEEIDALATGITL